MWWGLLELFVIIPLYPIGILLFEGHGVLNTIMGPMTTLHLSAQSRAIPTFLPVLVKELGIPDTAQTVWIPRGNLDALDVRPSVGVIDSLAVPRLVPSPVPVRSTLLGSVPLTPIMPYAAVAELIMWIQENPNAPRRASIESALRAGCEASIANADSESIMSVKVTVNGRLTGQDRASEVGMGFTHNQATWQSCSSLTSSGTGRLPKLGSFGIKVALSYVPYLQPVLEQSLVPERT